ncbi:nucleoside phosphorylase domain-containing protein, partial [Xylariales sp. PMI_506]
MPNPNDYTVGWICAVKTEYVAARAFLDEEHEAPDHQSPSDNNAYTLGKVGKHNVVIATLPMGQYGTTAAATVARDMLHSFPKVRIGFMVGIGGGAPSAKYDIRLGDIVVGTPHEGKGGVFQYDFGKTIQDGEFRYTGSLNQPPLLLLNAVATLSGRYEADGHGFQGTLSKILQRKSRLRKEYAKPDLSTDRLYRSDVVHPPDSDLGCPMICNIDGDRLVLREQRTEDDDDPAIHYGLIASGNQLMKNARVRDLLASENDVMCFEMEAAGLMNHFPCLVIRGICDYSDSHKNKEWQGYAAMMAAAYAKDLLQRIPPTKIDAETPIAETLSGIENEISEVKKDTQRLVFEQYNQKDVAVLDWLTPIDFGPQQSDNLKRLQKGTGKWFLDSDKFKTWFQNANQTLFCPGIPGAGKTVLTSAVIADLESKFGNERNICITYIYFNYTRQDEQAIEDVLASLVKQLLMAQSPLPKVVHDLYDQHSKKRTRPLADELIQTLQSVIAMFSKVFIVIDALDECQSSNGHRSKFISEMLMLQAKTRANLFVTSRFDAETEQRFKKFPRLEIRASDEDIRSYIDDSMARFPSFILRDSNLQE